MQWLRNNHSSAFTTRNRKAMYNNLQEQYDALMVEPDIRLFENHHFDSEGRMAMSAAELKYPSTPFGELRRLAIMEHGKKKRAAQFISVWYARHLVKRGFIKDAKRRRELFAPPGEESLLVGQSSSQPRSGGFWQKLRQRPRSAPVPLEETGASTDSRVDLMERGMDKTSDLQPDDLPSTINVLSKGDDVNKSTTSMEARRMACDIIAEMDLGTISNKAV